MLQNRPPIIVILGHVDHGKTTLLDYLRRSNLAAREAGGITQSIKSFQLTTKDQKVLTFIDTPGHAAFTKMRTRGSQVADLALLIVAGNDGIMPQTKEAYEAITKSGIPFIVVITKSDLPEANPDRVKTQLTELGIVVEDFGGPVSSSVVSAKTGAGVPELLETIDLITSLEPPQADVTAHPEVYVIESQLDPKKGPVAEVIVKNGTLSVGQSLFSAAAIGKVKALFTSDGQSVTSAAPSTPVQVLGLTSVPDVGSVLSDIPVTTNKSTTTTAHPASSQGRVNIILKSDVLGSQEAILASIDSQINLLNVATGDVNENDVLMAKPTGAYIIAFNVKAPSSVAKLAEVEKVPLKTFRIIYELLDYLEELIHPKATETILGKAVVGAEFKIGPDRIAGCKVAEGLISKGDQLRLVRGDVVIGVTKFKTLQTGKAILEKAKVGQEFGATFSPYLDFKVGDNIIAFVKHGTP